MKIHPNTDVTLPQQHLRAWIKEYGTTAALEGTGLLLCDIQKTYTDPKPVYDHFVRVYQFYKGYAYQQSLNEQEDYAY